MKRETVYDLNLSLEIEKMILENAIREKERFTQIYEAKGFNIGISNIEGYSSEDKGPKIDLSKVVALIHQCDNMINLQEERIEKIQKDINEIYQLIRSMKGLNKKVYYLKLVEGKNLREIANELGYSYGYLRNI